ncbi:MAG: FkbM family methyltransferase [Acidobacteriota bacterium]
MIDFESRVELAYRNILSPGDRAIDIGAHRGRHALPMAECVGPDGWVIAFEPLPTARAALLGAVRSGRRAEAGLGVVEIRAEALADRVGQAEFVFVPDMPECSGLRERVYDAPVDVVRIDVRMALLDDVVADRGPFRLIKIDAEGGEHDIVRGATRLLRRDRPVVLFEMGDNALVNYPHVTSAGMAEQLTALDYRLLDILGRPLDPAAFAASCAEQAVWDYAAVPAEQQATIEHLQTALAAA